MMTGNQQLLAEIEFLKTALAERDRAHCTKDSEIKLLLEMVEFFKMQRFGRKSETIHPGQRLLFNEADADGSTDSEDVEVEFDGRDDETKPRRTKPRRKPLPGFLARVEQIFDLPDDKKFCSHTGEPLRRVGEEVSEQLDIIPALIQVIRTIRPKYACSCGNSDCKFHIAPKPNLPIPKSMASAGFLAYIATAKYADATPLYRQEEILNRIGCDLPRSTLASWMMRCGELAMPIINLMREKILEAPLVYCDETALQVLKGTGKKPTARTYMWVQAKWGGTGQRLVLYNYENSRQVAVALKLFEGYRGYVQTDGYEGYSRLSSIPGITLVGDWVHVRRAFHHVIKSGGKGGLASKALEYIAALYQIENESQGLSPDELIKARKARSKPVLDEMRAWVDVAQHKVPPKSLVGKAFRYFNSQWHKLSYFLEDPVVGLDTNAVENAIRPFALILLSVGKIGYSVTRSGERRPVLLSTA